MLLYNSVINFLEFNYGINLIEHKLYNNTVKSYQKAYYK